MDKFNKQFNKIINEDESMIQLQLPMSEKTPSSSFDFEDYEEIGMSAELGIDELINSTTEQILKEVPENKQVGARIAVKKLWMEKIKDWKSFN